MSDGDSFSEHDSTLTAEAPDAEFIQLFTRAQRRLYLFILSQVADPVDAEEILQEANLVIWRKCQEFELGTNFQAWVNRIARLEILKYRERLHRSRLTFSDEFVRRVAEEAPTELEQLQERRRALSHCLNKLREKDRELIQRRYAPGENGKSVAQALGRPVNSVYQSLGRIRRTLLECMRRYLTAEAGS